MDKVLICLEVPSVGGQFDVNVPLHVSVGQIIRMLCTALKELSGGRYISSGEETLCLMEPLWILNSNHTLGDYSVKNGDRLYLL